MTRWTFKKGVTMETSGGAEHVRYAADAQEPRPEVPNWMRPFMESDGGGLHADTPEDVALFLSKYHAAVREASAAPEPRMALERLIASVEASIPSNYRTPTIDALRNDIEAARVALAEASAAPELDADAAATAVCNYGHHFVGHTGRPVTECPMYEDHKRLAAAVLAARGPR